MMQCRYRMGISFLHLGDIYVRSRPRLHLPRTRDMGTKVFTRTPFGWRIRYKQFK